MVDQTLKNAAILIVDDQEANVLVLEHLLEHEGFFHFKSTTDSRQALALYAEFQPDLILLDLLMPHLDGFAVMEQLRAVIPANSYVPILVLTADITPEAKQRTLSGGARDFLTKPIDVVEVLLRVKNLLETRFLYLQLQNQNQRLEEKVRERTAELAQAHGELRQRFDELQILYQLIETVSRAADVQAVYTEALNGLQRSVHPDRAAILLYDPDGVMRFKAWRGLSPEYRQRTEGHVPWTPEDRDPQPILISDMTTTPALESLRAVILQEGIRALGFIPLVYQGRLLGKFMLYYDAPHAFSADEIRQAQTIAGHIAFATERKRSEAQLQWLASFPTLNPNPILEIDRAGAITYLNPAAESRFPGLLADGPKHSLLRDLPTVVAQFQDRDKDYLVREAPVGNAFYEEHIWSVADGRLFRIYALNITERKQAEAHSRREAARTEALLRTASRLNARLDLQAVLNAMCEETAHALAVPAVVVTLYDAQSEAFYVAADVGLPPDFRERLQPMPRRLYDAYAGQSGSLIVIRDMQSQPDLPNAELYAALDIRTVASASMRRDGQLVGTLNLVTFGEARLFSEDELALLQGLADQAAQAIVNARLFVETEQRLQRLGALRNIDMAITASLNLHLTLNVVLEQVTAHLQVDAASILLLNPYLHRLEYAAGRGFLTPVIKQASLHLGEGQAGRAALERKLIHLPDLAQAGAPFSSTPLAGEGFQAYAAAPLIAKGEVKGVLEVFHRIPLDADPEWLNFLETLAGQAAIAVDNARLFEGLQRANLDLVLAYDATIEGWSRALDLRDKETEGHTLRVTEMTERLARAAGLSDEELVQVRRGALLHDIGKMGVPDGILLKPGKLTDDEWVIMRKHPQYAYDLLSPIAYLRPALDIPFCHHEKWDGTGYPRGLKGEQIPLAARLFAVVDVWDALRSDRPYRAGWPEGKVLEHIRSLAGTHFDPQAVDVFLNGPARGQGPV